MKDEINKRFEERFDLEDQGCSECGGFELVDKTEVKYPKGKYHCEYDLEKVKSFLHQEIERAVMEATHCQKSVEDGKAICGVKLDCHLHDWRAKEYAERAVAERDRIWKTELEIITQTLRDTELKGFADKIERRIQSLLTKEK